MACAPAPAPAGTPITAHTSLLDPPLMTPVLVITVERLATEQSAPRLLRKVTVQPAGSVLLPPNVVVDEASRSKESLTPALLVLLTYRTNVAVEPGFAAMFTTGETSGPGPTPSTPGPPRAALLVKST